MTKLEYSIILENDKEKLFKIATDYENLTKYLPDQLKSVRISEKNQDTTITESTVMFKTIFKKEISIVSKHTEKNHNNLRKILWIKKLFFGLILTLFNLV